MCHNPGTWHNCTQVKLTSERSCQRTNCKLKYKLESQNPHRNNRANVTWEQLCQCHLGTIVPVSFRNNRASFTWEISCQPHLGTVVPSRLGTTVSVSLGNDFINVTQEQLRGCHLGTIVPVPLVSVVSVSLGNYRGSVLWVQLYQFHLGTTLPVQFGNKSKLIYFSLTKEMGNDIRYVMSFSLQNLIYKYTTSQIRQNTFNDFLLANIYGYSIVCMKSALIQEIISSKRF